jgi:RimJ/RimL family protein N-acetyltransferase
VSGRSLFHLPPERPSYTQGVTFAFRRITASDALQIVAWRYPAPYDFYNHPAADETAVRDLLRLDYRYHAIDDQSGRLTGYFCLGADAQVPGWTYDGGYVDLGMGLDPAVTGQGIGSSCLEAILHHLHREGVTRLRATVAAWNHRALRLCGKAEFQQQASFVGQKSTFHVLTRSPLPELHGGDRKFPPQ